MQSKNKEVNLYIDSLENWKSGIKSLRKILLEAELLECYKWKQPCYTFNGKNIAIIGDLKDSFTLSFFKGALILDKNKILESPGPNSRHSKHIKFSNVNEVKKLEKEIRKLLSAAIKIEEEGLVVGKDKQEIKIPSALVDSFEENSKLRDAFYKLTKGKQRGYVLQIQSAKTEETMLRRIEKFKPRILKGLGLQDCICGKSKRMPRCDGSHSK